MRRIADFSLRILLTAAHQMLKLALLLRRQETCGAHALALTPRGKLILVKLRYAPGWRAPGGGRPAKENAEDAALRELREEIGMISHGEVEPAPLSEELVSSRRDSVSLMIVRDVRYRPRWSWEVEQVCEADLDALPAGLSEKTRAWVQALRPVL